jgi:hypothetical protein
MTLFLGMRPHKACADMIVKLRSEVNDLNEKLYLKTCPLIDN